MNDLRTAAQQALEALENCTDRVIELQQARARDYIAFKQLLAQRDALLEALKELLEVWEEDPSYGHASAEKARAALAEPVQEPVARRERLNPPPHVLSDALQDRVHITLDKGRAVKTLRIKPGCMGEERGEMTTAWAHLPNAAHIDRILAHVKAHPDKWAAARAAARWAANREAARATARWDAALNEVRVAAWDAARWDADWAAARSVAWDAILALITWDDAGGPLSLPIEAVKAMADEGNHAAVLIYPAMLAMEENNQ